VLASKQDISEATERGVLEGEVEDAVAAVEVAARKLQKALRNLKDTTTGPAHYDAWMVPFMGRLPGTEASYPDAFLEEILAALALARPRYYRRQPLKEHWHCFIREVQELFANYGVNRHAKLTHLGGL